MAKSLDRIVQKSESWISEMHADLKWMDTDDVYHLLRATLQTLRDQLNFNDALQFASQLPLLLRGTYYDCWDPKPKTRRSSKQEFLESVRQKLGLFGQPIFDLESGVNVALKVVFSHVSTVEIKDIVASFGDVIEKKELDPRQRPLDTSCLDPAPFYLVI